MQQLTSFIHNDINLLRGFAGTHRRCSESSCTSMYTPVSCAPAARTPNPLATIYVVTYRCILFFILTCIAITVYSHTDGDSGIPAIPTCPEHAGPGNASCHVYQPYQCPDSMPLSVVGVGLMNVHHGSQPDAVHIVYSYQLHFRVVGRPLHAFPSGEFSNLSVVVFFTVYEVDWRTLEDDLRVRREIPVAQDTIYLSRLSEYSGVAVLGVTLPRGKTYIVRAGDIGIIQQNVPGIGWVSLRARNDESAGADSGDFVH